MTPNVKPVFGIRLKTGHRLAAELVGAWLLSEGRGGVVGDAGRHRHEGELLGMTPAADWVAGPHGWALDFDGTDDRVIVGPDAGIPLGTSNACVIRLRPYVLSTDVYVGHKSYTDGGYLLSQNAGSVVYCAGGYWISVPHGYAAGQEVWLAVSRVGTQVTFYRNGHPLGSPQTLAANNEARISAIGAYRDGSSSSAASMRCDYVYVWSRALSEEEVRWLYREPFCFVGGGGWGLELLSAAAPTVRSLSGTVGASSSASGSLSVLHACDRPTGQPWRAITLDCERPWLREALFGGATDAGWGLGTALTRGWFWMRRSGASAVYRSEGPDASTAAFGSPVAVTAVDAGQVTLPAWLSHGPGSVCCYVLRRFNGAGAQERTVGTAAAVRIGADGRLAGPEPNAPFGVKFEIQNPKSETGRVVRLAWFYWPGGQRAAPRVFYVYGDGGTGEIDLVHPLGEVPYEGRKYYRWQSGALPAGEYRFVVRAATADGVESTLQGGIVCDTRVDASAVPEVVVVEAV